MSGPPPSRQMSGTKEIPTRKVLVNDPKELPSDYCTTPGGTMFGTTPGGTRIIYERQFLMNLRDSPLARTPPANLPVIPGVTVKGDAAVKTNGKVACSENNKEAVTNDTAEEPQFEMDI
ncbi:eukaryotic translation initiation factor 4E-binding protein 2-like [Acanthaster planci]|uniref:Eukaryotic translation initiation factor 4E-binding protein 2-like n=1 Tax=Acanthaster planci TaxID=133434 RepID=A0A8B7ZXA5_ACAPL|nr:eukaryotic translation initiation factor 4E-binding protein 2-like [Acanthaster planci]